MIYLLVNRLDGTIEDKTRDYKMAKILIGRLALENKFCQILSVWKRK